MLPILKEECMLFEISASSKENLLIQMADALDREGYLSDRNRFYQDVLDREKVFSTYIDYGIGIPHGKSAGVEESGICIARPSDPVAWSDNETDQVDFAIMIAVREKSDSNLHLQILSKLSRLLMHEDFRRQIKNGDRKQVYQVLKESLEVQE